MDILEKVIALNSYHHFTLMKNMRKFHLFFSLLLPLELRYFAETLLVQWLKTLTFARDCGSNLHREAKKATTYHNFSYIYL